jgi:thiol-disulfide isomerase/thioredoxin
MVAFTNRIVYPAVSPVASMVAWAILCVVAGGCPGCGGEKMTPIANAAQFKEAVLKADRPVLVDFYKGGCPTCLALNPKMDQLAEEYKGRVIVAKFMLMQTYFAVTSPQLKDTYDIQYYPTVILFVNGRATCRFLRDYDLAPYRKAIDEALIAATMPDTATSLGDD